MKPEVVEYVEKQFADFDKWETYGNVFSLMDARKITLRQIISIAGEYGISEEVIRMRRGDMLKM